MVLLLVRHGEAVQSRGGPDEERYLTERGRAESRALGAALAGRLSSRGLRVESVVASPLVRAVQTAELVAGEIGFEGVIATDAAFVPDADPRAALARIPSSHGGLVAVVCHEPIVRRMASLAASQRGLAQFHTGGAAWIEPGQGLVFLP